MKPTDLGAVVGSDADEETDETRTDGGEARTDGGTATSPFEVVSEFEETRSDRLRKRYDTYLYAPFKIIWKDWRARFGLTN